MIDGALLSPISKVGSASRQIEPTISFLPRSLQQLISDSRPGSIDYLHTYSIQHLGVLIRYAYNT